MYSNCSSSPVKTTTRPSRASCTHAPSCLIRPSAVRLIGIESGRTDRSRPPTRSGSARSGSGRCGTDVGRVPQVAGAYGIDAVASLELGLRAVLAEVAVEVLLAGEVRAPRRVPHGAVVECAEHCRAVRVGGRLHAIVRIVAAERATDRHRRLARDPAGVRRRPHDLPRVVAATAAADVDDVDAMGVDRLGRLLRRPVGLAVGEEQTVVGVLAVLDDQPLAASSDGSGSRRTRRCASPTAGPGRRRCCWRPACTPARRRRDRPRRSALAPCSRARPTRCQPTMAGSR